MLGYLIKLAAKNLMRQKRRTILTFLALSLGITCYITFDALMVGLDQTSINNVIGLDSGHIQIFPEPYLEERNKLTLDYTFEYQLLKEQLASIPEIEAFTPRLSFSAQLNNGMDELPVVAIGVDSTTDPQVFDLTKHLEGEMPRPGQFEAVIGARLADLMELGIGDYFTLITKTKAEAYQAIDLVITGLLNTPHPEINAQAVYLPLDTAGEALGIPAEATAVVVRTTSYDAVPKAVAAINRALSTNTDLRAYSWETIEAEFLVISKSERKFTSVFLLMILIIGIIGVVNTILLGSIERVKEIGMMKALGMKENQIVLAFALEALGIGLLGGLIGLLGGILCTSYFVNEGIDFAMFFDEDLDIGYPVSGTIYAAWNVPAMIMSVVFGIGVCVLASFLPARAAAANDPIQSLRQG